MYFGLVKALSAPLLYGHIVDARLPQFMLDEVQQIHAQADELRLHALGRRDIAGWTPTAYKP